MPVLGAFGSPLGGSGVAVGVLDGVECLLDVLLNLVVGLQPSVAYTYVDDEEGLGAQVLGELQHLVVAEAVGDIVTPVDAEVAGPLLDGANGVLPLEAVVEAIALSGLPLDVASARETHELGVQGLEHLGEVDAAAVGTTLVGGREEADDVERERAGLREGQAQTALGVAGFGLDADVLDLLPTAGLQLECGRGGAQFAAITPHKGGGDIALVGTLGLDPEGEGVGGLLTEGHAPVALVLDTSASCAERELQVVGLAVVERTLGGERGYGLPYGLPMGGRGGIVLERTVMNQLGIEAAIASMIDFLEKDSIQTRTDGCARVRHIDRDHGLSMDAQAG